MHCIKEYKEVAFFRNPLTFLKLICKEYKKSSKKESKQYTWKQSENRFESKNNPMVWYKK